MCVLFVCVLCVYCRVVQDIDQFSSELIHCFMGLITTSKNLGVACAIVSRLTWTNIFLDVVIWPIEQWINSV